MRSVFMLKKKIFKANSLAIQATVFRKTCTAHKIGALCFQSWNDWSSS